uniref:hypothetical protein n=1 Tax=Collinsella sp. BA40 TaxID=2560852 RepID=UPI001C9BFB42
NRNALKVKEPPLRTAQTVMGGAIAFGHWEAKARAAVAPMCHAYKKRRHLRGCRRWCGTFA